MTSDSRLTRLRNAWAVSWLGGGIEEPRPLPAEVIYDRPHAQLRRFTADGPTSGNPVLLVPPLAVPAWCWDLRPGQSLAEHLVRKGRPTYVIDYGDITFRDRAMGFEHWIRDILPTAIQRVSEDHGGRPVHLIGWSLGGTLSLLTAGFSQDLPIASIVALGTPIDYALNASSKPLRWLDRRLGTNAVTLPTAALGGVPAPAVKTVYRALAPVREITKPWFLYKNLHDSETLARSEVIDRFMAAMPGYPGRLYHQMHTRLIVRRELTTGVVHLANDCVVHLDRLNVPVTLIGSTTDAIASTAAVKAGIEALPGSPSVEYREVAELSHLGLIASASAATLTWPIVDEHLERFSGQEHDRPAHR